MERDFYLAAIPEQVQVLGFTLRPLTLGHVIILNRIDCGYVTGSETGINDLACAVFVCSQSYKDAINGLAELQRDGGRFMKRWHERLSGSNRLLVRLGFRKAKLVDVAAEAQTFVSYLKTHTKIPNYSYKEGDFATMDCPAVQIVKVTLMRDMGFSEAELLDRSWALCLWDHITLKALAGHVHMVYENTIEQAQEVGRKLMEAVKAGKLKVPDGNS